MVKILLLEDDEFERQHLVICLADAGFDVREAVDGVDGLAKVMTFKPDLIISDINMPNLNGIDFLKAVKDENLVSAECPIIFLSANKNQSDIVAGLSLGADDYLTKPVDTDILIAKIHAATRQVGRIKSKNKRDQVKLYKALTRDSSEPYPQGQPSLLDDYASLKIALVGKDEAELVATKNVLEAEGHQVEAINSGNNYVRQLCPDFPDLTIFWLYSEDMQAHFTLKFARQKNEMHVGPYVIVWPGHLTQVDSGPIFETGEELVQSPFEWATLKSSILNVLAATPLENHARNPVRNIEPRI
jgi:DNA-binding response OmpR family regulator